MERGVASEGRLAVLDPAALDTLAMDPRAERSELRSALESKRMSVFGQVLDENERSLAGVVLTALLDSGAGPIEIGTTQTDEHGAYRLEADVRTEWMSDPAARHALSLRAHLEGKSPQVERLEWDPHREWAGAVSFRLEPGRSILGRVVDPKGRPVRGARVVRKKQGEALMEFMGIVQDALAQTTDSSGRFVMRLEDDPPIRIEARASELGVVQREIAMVPFGAGDVDLGDLVLQPLGVVVGRVLAADGTALANAEIGIGTRMEFPEDWAKQADPAELELREEYWMLTVQTEVAASDGSFVCRGLDPGRYQLSVPAEGATGTAIVGELETGKPKDLKLDRRVLVVTFVDDETGERVPTRSVDVRTLAADGSVRSSELEMVSGDLVLVLFEDTQRATFTLPNAAGGVVELTIETPLAERVLRKRLVVGRATFGRYRVCLDCPEGSEYDPWSVEFVSSATGVRLGKVSSRGAAAVLSPPIRAGRVDVLWALDRLPRGDSFLLTSGRLDGVDIIEGETRRVDLPREVAALLEFSSVIRTFPRPQLVRARLRSSESDTFEPLSFRLPGSGSAEFFDSSRPARTARAIPAGEYELEIEAPGWSVRPERSSVFLRSGQMTTVEVEFEPLPAEDRR